MLKDRRTAQGYIQLPLLPTRQTSLFLPPAPLYAHCLDRRMNCNRKPSQPPFPCGCTSTSPPCEAARSVSSCSDCVLETRITTRPVAPITARLFKRRALLHPARSACQRISKLPSKTFFVCGGGQWITQTDRASFQPIGEVVAIPPPPLLLHPTLVVELWYS